MDIRQVIDAYYELANAGEWDRWCELFAADQVMDEQLAGHVEGRETLRAMMKGFPDMYATFRNEPATYIVDGDQAAVISTITAVTPAGGQVRAHVVNYFRVSDGLITYMSNYHDTAPFRAVLPNL